MPCKQVLSNRYLLALDQCGEDKHRARSGLCKTVSMGPAADGLGPAFVWPAEHLENGYKQF